MTKIAPIDDDQFALGTFRGFDMRGDLADYPDPPILRAGAGRAHKARGTYSRMTEEDIAAFLAPKPRYVVLPSLGSLPVVYDTVEKHSVEHGRRFQPEAARREADRLNEEVAPA